MTESRSRYLRAQQVQSLDRIGDLYLPGTGSMPSFSASRCSDHVDSLLEAIPPGDRRSLALLLSVLRVVPLALLRLLLWFLDRHHRFPGLLAAPPRLLNLALKGTVMTLYFSGMNGEDGHGADVHAAMAFSLHCEPD